MQDNMEKFRFTFRVHSDAIDTVSVILDKHDVLKARKMITDELNGIEIDNIHTVEKFNSLMEKWILIYGNYSD